MNNYKQYIPVADQILQSNLPSVISEVTGGLWSHIFAPPPHPPNGFSGSTTEYILDNSVCVPSIFLDILMLVYKSNRFTLM